MVTESYCSLELCKLLKDKGFDGRENHCNTGYFNGSLIDYTLFGFCDGDIILTPAHQMAMDWLREEKNIFIAISVGYVGKESKRKYFWCPCVLKEDHIEYPIEHNDGSVDEMSNTFNEAVEDALKYSLTKLV